MIETLVLPVALREHIREAARLAYPRECCGLIEGMREGNLARAIAAHATRNIAEESDRFEIDPAEHIAILGSLRHGPTEIIGCYHSHPNGRPEPSARDRDAAFGENFLWLIASVSPDGRSSALRAFTMTTSATREIPMRDA